MRALMQTPMRTLLRLVYRLLYYELAWTYDRVSWLVSMGQWRAWQRASLTYLHGKKILELAHGTGNMLLDTKALGFEPVGIDFSQTMGRLARQKLRAHGLADVIPLAQAKVQALPFPTATFDSLLATFPTEYIGDPAAIREFYRILKVGGRLVCVPTARITGLGLTDRFANWLFRVTGQTSADWYTPLLQRYEAAGFTARVESATLPRSVVNIILAEKVSIHS
jgi:ubiquinone/menaquinone biosynthesis C-methylase UbiE